MNLNKSYDNGLTKDEYIATLKKHHDDFLHIYNNFSISKSDDDFFVSLQKRDLRVIVLAEEWCGHCMLDIPLLLHLVEKANLPIRFLLRDENLELMDEYLTDEKRIIPIFIFIDAEGNEVTTWGPMAPETKRYIDKLRKTLPVKEAPDYDEKFKNLITKTGDVFRSDESLWNAVYDDIKSVLL